MNLSGGLGAFNLLLDLKMGICHGCDLGKMGNAEHLMMMPDHCHFLRNLLSSASADSRIYFIENQCFDLVTICLDCLQGKHNSGIKRLKFSGCTVCHHVFQKKQFYREWL